MGGNAKQKHREKLIEYLSNPSHDYPSRDFLSITVLGFKNRQSIHKAFTAEELQDIEKIALELRRTKYAPDLAEVDKALLITAKIPGNEKAAKLAYQRFEGWGEKTDVNVSGALTVTHDLSPEAKEALDVIYNKG